jgi:phosphopentomutase
VERLDALVGSVMRTVRGRDDLRRSTVVVLTADHGGVPGTRSHGDRTRYDNYRVPFVVWGAGVRAAGLYGLNPTALRPGRTQPGFRGAQPIRNGDVANLALDILGLGPVPGSLWNHDQDLRWR